MYTHMNESKVNSQIMMDGFLMPKHSAKNLPRIVPDIGHPKYERQLSQRNLAKVEKQLITDQPMYLNAIIQGAVQIRELEKTISEKRRSVLLPALARWIS